MNVATQLGSIHVYLVTSYYDIITAINVHDKPKESH